jgi:trehalose 6-phosphate synthase/phosphatase
MSRECHKELETTVGRKWDVEVMTGKANLEVRPTFINKGEISKRLVTTYENVQFVLCIGDDFTDEDMFRALNALSAPPSPVAGNGSPANGSASANGAAGAGDVAQILKPEQCFTVTVGASTKVTLARWHLLEPEDVIECVALLAGVGGSGAGAQDDGEVNPATAVESAVDENIQSQL